MEKNWKFFKIGKIRKYDGSIFFEKKRFQPFKGHL